MISEGRQRVVVALAVAVSIGFVALAHAAVTRGEPSSLGAIVSLVPLAVVLFIVLRRAGHRVALGLGVTLAAIALWLGWDELERHFPDLLFVEHAGMNLALAWVFGRTLREGREPLIRLFARIAHGNQVPPGIERYTRMLTLIWALFFATLFVVSALLYFGGFPKAWSFLANILSPILIATLFVIEYAVRMRVLPHVERVGILAGVRAFVHHMQAARAQAPR